MNLNTSADMGALVGKFTMEIVGDRSVYGLNEAKAMAIRRVRAILEASLEEVMNSPYSGTVEVTYAAARLTLFNSIYR